MTHTNGDFSRGHFRRRNLTAWVVVLCIALLAGAALWLDRDIETPGLALRGEGHLVVLPEERGGAWAMLIVGSAVKLTPASVARLQPKTGPCRTIGGRLQGTELEVEELDCEPGPLQKPFGARLRQSRLKFAYWDASLKFEGESLEPHLETPEVMAAMFDGRTDAPQLVPLYAPLFPEPMVKLRREGRAPPPLLIAVKRDDQQRRRLGRLEASQFFSRKQMKIAAGAVEGGWVVRSLELVDDGAPPVAKLLLDPSSPPWPRLLREQVLTVTRPLLFPVTDANDGAGAAPSGSGRSTPSVAP